jgi:hypothetical protein
LDISSSPGNLPVSCDSAPILIKVFILVISLV